MRCFLFTTLLLAATARNSFAQANEANEVSLDLAIVHGVYATKLCMYNTSPGLVNEQFVHINLKESNSILFMDTTDNLEYYSMFELEDGCNEALAYMFRTSVVLNDNVTAPLEVHGSNAVSIKAFQSGLSLGFAPYNLNYSLTHQLYNSSAISSLSFTFFPNETNPHAAHSASGKIYFGKPPRHIINNKPSSSCSVSSHQYWSCHLTQVNLNVDKFYPVNMPITFNTYHSNTYVPKEFLEYLSSTLFAEAFQRKLCWNGRHELERGIVCSYKLDPVDWFGERTIAFVIESAVYEKKLAEMFIPYKDAFVFELSEYNDYWNRVTKWEFGGRFLKAYTTTFDYSEKRITFYKESTADMGANVYATSNMYIANSNSNTSLLTNITLVITAIGVCCVVCAMKCHKAELE